MDFLRPFTYFEAGAAPRRPRSKNRRLSSLSWHKIRWTSLSLQQKTPGFDLHCGRGLLCASSTIAGSGPTLTQVFLVLVSCIAVAGVQAHDDKATPSKTGNGTVAPIDSAPYKDFQLSPKGWAIVLGCVVIFWILLSILLACFCANTKQECHLCEQPVPSRKWESGEHMKTCYSEHERFIHDLPDSTFKSAKCKHCPKQLKVWPVDVGQSGFQCQQGLNCERLKLRRDAGKKRGRRRKRVLLRPGVVVNGNGIGGSGINNKNQVEDDVESFEFAVDENGKPIVDFADIDSGENPPVWCENNGSNRLCCFEHGYEICDRCALYLDRVKENGAATSRIGASQRSSLSQETGVGSGQTRPNGVVVGGSGSRGSVSLVLNGNVRKSSHSSSKPRSGGDAWTTQDGVQLSLAISTCRGLLDELPYAFTDAEHRISMENQYYGGATGFFEILEPEELQYTYSITPSQFSPFFNSSSNADMGGHVKYMTLAEPPCGCGPLTNSVRDKVVLIQRGECSFVSKAARAEEAGAFGAIVADNDEKNDELTISMTDDQTDRKINIPVAFLLGMDGYYIRRVLERNGLNQAVIQIPVNISQKAILGILTVANPAT